MSPQNADCEVLVVGAGPTGLLAATLLRRCGVRVHIVDDRPHASRESRAFVIQARSLEIFAQIGLADELLSRGVINSGVDFYVGGKHTGGLNFDDVPSPDTPYRFVFMLPQSETEAVLIEDVSGQGLEIERGVKVTGLTQDADGVTTHATAADGSFFDIRSAYVLGADGAHSIVRKALGLSFEGSQYAHSFLLADCRVKWPLDHHRFRAFLHRDAIALFLPLKGAGLSRVMAMDQHAPDHDDGRGGGPAGVSQLELPELQDALRQASRMDVELSDPVWITRYRVHHRGVERYRVGRGFVAGDAAHIHSPAGGQGMNTGLQDAANLAWKLAAVLRGGAVPALLDTYHDERHPVGAQVVATTDKAFTVATKTGWEASVRDWIMGPLTATVAHLASVQQKAFRTVSEIDIAYAPNAFVEETRGADFHGGPAAGQRAPNAAITRRRDVFDLFAGYGFTVLAFSRRPLEAEELTRLKTALDGLAAARAHIVARLPFGRDERVEFAETAAAFTAYGITEATPRALYLVRPDGYVAWRATGLDVESCRRFLTRFGADFRSI